jgi:nanoRNase/pAp phosphatase (c-di-AMP/oligoRNAs hydrolase)
MKDIEITYDLALLETQRDINDEAIWGILTERYEARKRAELRRVGDMQVLRSLEKEKMHKEEE